MRPPGPPGLEMLKTIWGFQRRPLETLADVTARYGDLVSYRFGPFPVVLLNHPDAVHRMLVDNHTNYGKSKSPFYKMLKSFLGEGLLTSDGDYWLRQRRLAQPAFQRKKIEALSGVIVDCTHQMLEDWSRLPAGTKLDASQEMMRLTLRIVGLMLFSQDLGVLHDSVSQALDEIQVQMGERFSSLVPLPPVLPTARDRRFREARDELDRLALGIVTSRRQQTERPQDLLTSLIEARDPETGDSMTDQQIREELVTFMLAGHETTANTLTWALYLLSLCPAERRRLETEVSQGEVPAKGVCDRIILETLRLYPPAWVFGRRSHGPDRFGEFTIGPQQIVTVSPYILHRHPKFWPNPEGFDPDRFLDPVPKGAYVPFAAGPRQCIGNHFALLESRLILSEITRRVRVNLVAGYRPVLEPMITLRPQGGLPVTLEFRH